MTGMTQVGLQGMPGLPAQNGIEAQTAIQEFNARGNELLNQGLYKEAVAEYNMALGTLNTFSKLTVDFGPADPLVLWNRSAAYVLLGRYRMYCL